MQGEENSSTKGDAHTKMCSKAKSTQKILKDMVKKVEQANMETASFSQLNKLSSLVNKHAGLKPQIGLGIPKLNKPPLPMNPFTENQ